MLAWCSWCGLGTYAEHTRRCRRCNQPQGERLTTYTRSDYLEPHRGHWLGGCDMPRARHDRRNAMAWCAARSAFWERDPNVPAVGGEGYYVAAEQDQARISECLEAWVQRELRRHARHVAETAVLDHLRNVRGGIGVEELEALAAVAAVAAQDAGLRFVRRATLHVEGDALILRLFGAGDLLLA